MTVNKASGFSRFLVSADQICDYIPIVSTASNATDLIAKAVFRASALLSDSAKNKISKNYYANHIANKKTAKQCVFASIPFVKIGAFIYKKMTSKGSDLSGDRASTAQEKDDSCSGIQMLKETENKGVSEFQHGDLLLQKGSLVAKGAVGAFFRLVGENGYQKKLGIKEYIKTDDGSIHQEHKSSLKIHGDRKKEGVLKVKYVVAEDALKKDGLTHKKVAKKVVYSLYDGNGIDLIENHIASLDQSERTKKGLAFARMVNQGILNIYNSGLYHLDHKLNNIVFKIVPNDEIGFKLKICDTASDVDRNNLPKNVRLLKADLDRFARLIPKIEGTRSPVTSSEADNEALRALRREIIGVKFAGQPRSLDELIAALDSLLEKKVVLAAALVTVALLDGAKDRDTLYSNLFDEGNIVNVLQVRGFFKGLTLHQREMLTAALAEDYKQRPTITAFCSAFV